MARTRPRVLIVEDHTATVDAFCEGFRRAGFDVDSATTISDALAFLSTGRYGAIVTDLGLPDIASVAVLAALRGVAPHSPIVVCSGILTDELRDQTAGFGAAAVLEKPVTLAQLVGAVANAA